jgi:fatty-acid desaturase
MGHTFPLRKFNAFYMGVFHLGAFLALISPLVGPYLGPAFTPSWRHFVIFVVIANVTSSFGIGVCYHRLLTHVGFKTPKVVEYALAMIGNLAQQGAPIIWVAIHRLHHQHTEESGVDPHTPHDGEWWSHMDWMIHPDPNLRKRIDLTKLTKDMYRQRFYRSRYMHFVAPSLHAAACLYFGGILGLLWWFFSPVTVGWQRTWLVNSATHLWGKRRFTEKGVGDSRNNWWVALLTHGEGWHNNHHRHPSSVRHGFKWYEIDTNWYRIRVMKMLGLAKQVKEFS